MLSNAHIDFQSRRIAVLMGGNSSEREISLLSGGAIYKALENEGIDVTAIDVNENIREQISESGCDTAFIALHGKGGEDGRIQTILEHMQIAYTGSGPEASLNAFDKECTKRILFESKIPQPSYVVVHSDDWERKVEEIRFPVFIKPLQNGSSIGVYRCRNKTECAHYFSTIFKSEQMYLVEEEIRGREITVGILGKEALPIIELKPSNDFYDYNAKYTAGKTEYLIPAQFPTERYAYFQNLALATHQALGARDFSRVDMMVDTNEEAYVLELNSIPGFTATSLLPKAAQCAGVSFGELCKNILKMAIQRGSVHGTTQKA